jgi:hypothetical protein
MSFNWSLNDRAVPEGFDALPPFHGRPSSERNMGTACDFALPRNFADLVAKGVKRMEAKN